MAVEDNVGALNIAFGFMGYFPAGKKEARNVAADQLAFAKAVEAVTPTIVERARTLTKDTDSRVVFASLVGASTTFVRRAGTFDKARFTAALESIDDGLLTKASGLMGTSEVQRTEVLFVLLRAAGRYLGKDGTFDKQTFLTKSKSVTPQQVQQATQAVKDPFAALEQCLMP